MQNKLGLEFFDLPGEMQYDTIQHLSTPEVLNYALISKNEFSLFTPIITIRKFLHYATRGRYDIVKTMLKDNIALIVARGKVTDYSGRTFENISAFEYTLWAKDKPMWTVLLNDIPQNEKTTNILARLISQYNNVKTNGVTYVLQDKQVTERHFDFENTIIKELEIQVSHIHQTNNNINWNDADAQWITGVGNAQKLCPMHIVYEYCSDRPFYPLPNFANPIKLLLSQQFYNYNVYEDWFASDSNLGINFAITKGGLKNPHSGGGSRGRACLRDLAAMRALCERRTIDFNNLESKLETLVSEDYQSKPTPHS